VTATPTSQQHGPGPGHRATSPTPISRLSLGTLAAVVLVALIIFVLVLTIDF